MATKVDKKNAIRQGITEAEIVYFQNLAGKTFLYVCGGEYMPKTSYICNCDVIHEDIVNDVKSKMQPKDDYIQLASLFKLFGDGTRVQILHALEQSEMCVCDLAVLLGVTKSAISHQLKALRLANLVKFRKEAQIVYYSLADDHVKEIIDKGFEHLWQK